VEDDGVHAVVIATPNRVHREIALAAFALGKHVLCEKPLALDLADAREMHAAGERAGVRHMTAFTYRFVPGMRYLKHLVDSGYLGEPLHFRAIRLQDWGRRALGWRQLAAEAGTGEIGDMLSHRLDYGHLLLGPMSRVVADTRLNVRERDGGRADVEDWVGGLCRFAGGPSGVFESSKTAAGRGDGATGLDLCELNGTEGSVVYTLGDPNHIQMGRAGGRMERTPVPPEFLKIPGSPRDPSQGDPLQVFRYDQDFEFVSAIREERPCRPSFEDGVRAQAVIAALVDSAREGRWVDVEPV
jgi:predicted dehydrogenase